MLNVYLNVTEALYAHLDLYHLVAATVGWAASEPAGSVHSMWSCSVPNRGKKGIKAAVIGGYVSIGFLHQETKMFANSCRKIA